MRPTRIHIYGGPASGKSTIARKLARELGYRHVDLDDLYWSASSQRYDTPRDVVDRDGKLAEIVTGDGWIVEGSYYKWVSPSFRRAQLICYLNTPRPVRQLRLLRRHIGRRIVSGRRESLADFWSISQWSYRFEADKVPKAHALVQSLGQQWLECAGATAVQRAVQSPQ